MEDLRMSNPNYRNENGKIAIKINDEWIEPKFDHYDNIEALGETGANGVVITGIHGVTGRKEAIKIWLPRKRGNTIVLREEQYREEVRKIANLNDPRIATVYDAWTENGCLCCSMEYIDGQTYTKWLERNLDEFRRLAILKKIFETIVFYQNQGIIHGDIHSNNIMIDNNNNVHIIDFGTSTFSGYANQSVYRENFLMYELIKKTLGDIFDEKAFIFRKYNINGRIKTEDDVRNAIPVLFSRTALSYLKLMELLGMESDIVNGSDVINEYCRHIAEGVYLNMDYFCKQLFKKSKPNEEKLLRLGECMYEALENFEYAECQNDKYGLAEKMLYLSLFVYYDIVKTGLNNKTIESALVEEKIKGISCELGNKSIVLKAFYGNDSLLTFHAELISQIEWPEVNEIESHLRGELFSALQEMYDDVFLYMVRKINLKLEEIKLNKELCNDIERLPYTYCYNFGLIDR